MSVQRWYIQNPPGQPTEFVSYADHVAAVAEASQHGLAVGDAEGYKRGQRDERERIRKAVLGLVAWVVGPIRENGVVTRAVWLNKVLAIIDGETP
jgi:hypothetical protein